MLKTNSTNKNCFAQLKVPFRTDLVAEIGVESVVDLEFNLKKPR